MFGPLKNCYEVFLNTPCQYIVGWSSGNFILFTLACNLFKFCKRLLKQESQVRKTILETNSKTALVQEVVLYFL